MLSRVAERIYWLSRYMERVENTARLVNVYSNLLLDLPRGSTVGWETLIYIAGGDQVFLEMFGKADERNVTRFLLMQKNYPGSILNSILMARENARTTREVIPMEAWELINDLYLFTKKSEGSVNSRIGRQDFLKRVIASCQQLCGLLSSSVSENAAYEFIVMGRHLERADMTSRIVDVGAANLMNKSKDIIDLEPYENTLWMNVLRSINGYQMYRQHVQNRITGKDVVQFLLLDTAFPRSVLYCLNRLATAASQLPNHQECLRTVASTQRRVKESNVVELLANEALYDYIDELQLEYSSIHNAIAATWFLKPVEQQSQVQSGAA